MVQWNEFVLKVFSKIFKNYYNCKFWEVAITFTYWYITHKNFGHRKKSNNLGKFDNHKSTP